MGTVVRYATPSEARPRERPEGSATILIFPGVRIERAAPPQPPATPRKRSRAAKKAT